MAQVSTRVVAALAALSLAVPALAACSDDPPSGSPPPTSSSSSPTGSATPSGPPVMPAAAKGRTPQAAEAFVRYYVDLINYGLETLDSEPLRLNSTTACDLCRSFADALEELESRDGTYEGGRWVIRSIRRIPSAEASYVIQAVVRIGKERIIQRSPEGEARNPARRTSYTFRISNGAASPRVIDLQGVRR